MFVLFCFVLFFVVVLLGCFFGFCLAFFYFYLTPHSIHYYYGYMMSDIK